MDEKMYNEAICGGLIPFLLRCVRTHGFVYNKRCNTDNGCFKCL